MPAQEKNRTEYIVFYSSTTFVVKGTRNASCKSRPNRQFTRCPHRNGTIRFVFPRAYLIVVATSSCHFASILIPFSTMTEMDRQWTPKLVPLYFNPG